MDSRLHVPRAIDSMPEPTDRNMSESTRLHLRSALTCSHVHACCLSALTLDPVQPAQGDRLADRLPDEQHARSL